jgi:CheY-like chemotaxis protein
MNATLHALIVEDLDFWQDAVREVLTDAGYRVWIAFSYAEALDALAKNEIHVAVIDPVLDEANRHNRDGLRVLQHILDGQPNVCAIVYTSSDPKRIAREVGEMSADIPVLWKDEWDDDRFLAVVRDLFAAKEV